MATSANARIKVELSRSLSALAAMTDGGSHTVFTKSGATIWSGKTGYEPSIRPDGIVSGRNLLSTHTDNNKVTVAGFTAYLAGVLYTVAATTATVTRPATAVAKVIGIHLDSDGSTINAVAGTDGSTTAFSEARGAAGGPPYVPVGDIEIGQVRLTSNTAGVVLAAEIFQVDGTHTERSDLPGWTVDNIGRGLDAETSAEANAHVKFSSALDTRHTADTCKKVYAQVYVPSGTALQRALDFKPAEYSYSASSEAYYQGAIASTSSSLGQASFTVLMDDGVTDQILREKGSVSTVWFYPHKDGAPFSLSQGTMAGTREYPVANQNKLSATLTCEVPTADFAS